MFSAIGSAISAARSRTLRATPRRSTVEVVDMLNGKTDREPNSIRMSNDQSKEMPQVDTSGSDPPEQVTRTSPRKRKEQPTEAAGVSKLRRPNTRSSGGAIDLSALQPDSSKSEAARSRRRDAYDVPEDPAPASKKQKSLKKKAPLSNFDGASPADLPEPETEPVSTPALATRSHGNRQRPSDHPGSTADKGRQGQSSRRQVTKKPKNFLAQAAERPSEPESTHPELSNAPATPRRARPWKSTVLGKARPSHVASKDAVSQHAPAENAHGTYVAGSKPPVEADEEASEYAVDEAENSIDDTQIDRLSGSVTQANTSKQRNSKSKMDAEDVRQAIEGVKDAIKLFECDFAWTKVMVYAKKMVAPARTAKSKEIQQVMEIIQRMKKVYNIILQSEVSKDALDEAETEITLRLEKLDEISGGCAAAESSVFDQAFIEQIHEQIVPRMLFLIKIALAARWNEDEKNVSFDALEELVELMNITFAFRETAEKAKNRPAGLTNEKGELILGLARDVIANLRIIRKKYVTVINNRYVEATREAERQRRLEEMEREKRRIAEIAQRREGQRTKQHREMLQEYASREDERAKTLAEEVAADRKLWKQDLILQAKSGRIEAQRLCDKLGYIYYRRRSRPTGRRDEDGVVDIDDLHDLELELDSDFEPINPHPMEPKMNGGSRARPRPHREPTEDIPAPATSPKWTEKQNLVLLWGLETFLGADRFENILNAPEAGSLLRGMDVVDLMQQALRLKETMVRAIERAPGEWTWLSTVRRSDELR